MRSRDVLSPDDPRVAAILAQAQGPATEDELRHEASVVDAMAQVLAESRGEAATLTVHEGGQPADRARRGVKTVGRVAAVKGATVVGVVAFGVAAAAATTGVVISGLGSNGKSPPAPAETPSVVEDDDPGAGEDSDSRTTGDRTDDQADDLEDSDVPTTDVPGDQSTTTSVPGHQTTSSTPGQSGTGSDADPDAPDPGQPEGDLRPRRGPPFGDPPGQAGDHPKPGVTTTTTTTTTPGV